MYFGTTASARPAEGIRLGSARIALGGGTTSPIMAEE
jgi:hypothetical protein